MISTKKNYRGELEIVAIHTKTCETSNVENCPSEIKRPAIHNNQPENEASAEKHSSREIQRAARYEIRREEDCRCELKRAAICYNQNQCEASAAIYYRECETKEARSRELEKTGTIGEKIETNITEGAENNKLMETPIRH